MLAVVKLVVAYLSAIASIYWAWRFFAIVTPRLLIDDRYLRGVYGNIGVLTILLWFICSCGCFFCASAIQNETFRLSVIVVVGGTWGAILFVSFYYGWVALDRYPGRILW